MKIEVEMLAFGKGKIRTVTIPDEVPEKEILGQVFYFGQNDFCTSEDREQRLPSVSVGDVIRLPSGTRYIVRGAGFGAL